MTPTERSKRRHQKMVESGHVALQVYLDRGAVDFIDRLAQVGRRTRRQVLEEMLQCEYARWRMLVSKIEDMRAAGASEEEIIREGTRHLSINGPDHVVTPDQLRKVLRAGRNEAQ